MPKDGPSAGVAMTVALTSLVTGEAGGCRRGDDGRGHAHRPGAAGRRPQGEVAGRAARRDQAGDRPRAATRARSRRSPSTSCGELEFVYVDRIERRRSTPRSSRGRGGAPARQRVYVCERQTSESGGEKSMAEARRLRRPRRGGRRRPNEYVRRLIEDEELRDNLRDAYERGRRRHTAGSRTQKPGEGADGRQEDPQGAARAPPSRCARRRISLRGKKDKRGTLRQAARDRDRRRRRSRSSSARTSARRCSTASSAPRRSSSTPRPRASADPATARARPARRAASARSDTSAHYYG